MTDRPKQMIPIGGKAMSEVREGASGCPADEPFVFGKKIECPLCGKEFKNPTVKASKARMIGSDVDLRPRYEGINPLKYDVIMCPNCGYSGLERYFKTVTQVQKSLIKDNICMVYQRREEKDTFAYEDAFLRYKMALLNCMVKQSPDSEKAYICLKMGWLFRGWRESIPEEQAEVRAKLADQENEYLKNAKLGLEQANMKEDYPICGMDESTVDYLVAALSARFEEYDAALKLLSGIIASRAAGVRVKDRARDLKDEILQKQGAQENSEQ